MNKNCPGCGGGEENQSCKIERCGMEHNGIQCCFQCSQTTLFCVAVNLLQLQNLQMVLKEIDCKPEMKTLPIKEKRDNLTIS